MLNAEQAREYNRHQKLINYYSLNEKTYTTYQPFADEVKLYTTNFNTFKSYVPEKGDNGVSITTGQKNLKGSIAVTAADICNTAAAYAVTYSNPDLANAMNHDKSSILKQKDADILGFVKRLIDKLTPLLTDENFIKYDITQEMLDNLLADANTFNDSIGQAGIVDSGSSIANKNINAVIELLKGNITQFERLINKFAAKFPEFVAGYHINAALENKGVRHSGFKGIITDAVTNLPIRGVKITVVGKNADKTKTATSSLLGYYELISMYSGDYQVTFSAPGYTSKTIIIHVTRSRIAELNIAL